MNDDVVQFIFQVTREAHDRGVLSTWTVFDHPADFPDSYVARRGETDKDGYRPTKDVIAGELADIRLAMEICGFYCMPRADVDPMNIVETWM